jgi:hypothetical protein
MLITKLDSVDSKKKKKEIYIKFCDIEKLTNKKNVRKFIYSFRKCKNENLKKYEPAKKKELKSIIGKLSLKEIIEIYNGVN